MPLLNMRSRSTTPLPNAYETPSINSSEQAPRGLPMDPTTLPYKVQNPMFAGSGQYAASSPEVTTAPLTPPDDVDGWTSRHTLANVHSSDQRPHMVPQYSEIGSRHVVPMVLFQNTMHHSPWISNGYPLPSSINHSLMVERPHVGPIPIYGNDLQQRYQNIPYNNYYSPSEYGTYFPVQPAEPFADQSFAVYPYQAISFPGPGVPTNHRPFNNESIQHLGSPAFDYSSTRSPQFLFPPRVIVTPPIPPLPAQQHGMHYYPVVKDDAHHLPNQPFDKLQSKYRDNPMPVSYHSRSPKKGSLSKPSPHNKYMPNASTSRSTPTSGNTRLSRRGTTRPSRSGLLDEMKNNNYQTWNLEIVFGHVVEFSRDQHGSRFIQYHLEQASEDDKETIFKEIVQHGINNLVQDVFGNYVIQKFYEFGNQEQLHKITCAVEEQASQHSLNVYGCRVVQKALDYISPEQKAKIIRRLEPCILTCIKDAHGNHVVQKLIETAPPEHLNFLPIICQNILELATHPYGCRVLQRCLEHLPADYTRSLLDAIHSHTLDLMKDQYGNYVIQFIMEQGQERDRAIVLASIRGNLVRLACHKYASNVCEKALFCTNSESRQILINEIMTTKPRIPGENPILLMVKDQYANYVLQRALTLSEGHQRDTFFNQVKPLLVYLRKLTTAYSRPLVSIERLIDEYFNNVPSAGTEATKQPNPVR